MWNQLSSFDEKIVWMETKYVNFSGVIEKQLQLSQRNISRKVDE